MWIETFEGGDPNNRPDKVVNLDRCTDVGLVLAGDPANPLWYIKATWAEGDALLTPPQPEAEALEAYGRLTQLIASRNLEQ